MVGVRIAETLLASMFLVDSSIVDQCRLHSSCQFHLMTTQQSVIVWLPKVQFLQFIYYKWYNICIVFLCLLLIYTLVCTFKVIISFFNNFLGWFEKANYQSSISVDYFMLKFIYSEKATKFCEIFPFLLSVCIVDKS